MKTRKDKNITALSGFRFFVVVVVFLPLIYRSVVFTQFLSAVFVS